MKLAYFILLMQIFNIIVMPNMGRSRRSSEGEEEVKGPERSLVEWREEKRRLEEKLEEKKRKTRLDSLMSFSIDGGSILEIQRYEILYTNADLRFTKIHS